MQRLGIEEMKLNFVMSVYESITKQIQQMDIKISILLSWNGAVAVLLGREVTLFIRAKLDDPLMVGLAIAATAAMLVSGFFCYKVLKPRTKMIENRFDGLLWSGDIQKLGAENADRITNYLNQLLLIDSHEKLYEQYITSIVLISDIHLYKNRKFIQGLLATLASFFLLLTLMALMGLTQGKL